MHTLAKSLIKIGTTLKTVVMVTPEDLQANKEVKQFHHIHIIDRSGSMYGSINSLIDNIQNTIEGIPANDLISIIWFSSPSVYKTVVKGMKKDATINETLNKLRSVIGVTCFSDPIKEAGLIIEELYDICPNISVTFFTDGHPVVPWTIEEEERKIFNSLNAIKDKVVAINTVGYGSYYNRELLKSIADVTEFGVFFHSKDINEYKSIFQNNFEVINDMCSNPVEIKGQNVIYVGSKFTKLADGIKLSRLDKEKNVFYVVGGKNDFDFEIDGETYNSSTIKASIDKQKEADFLYAYAYNLFYSGERRKCLDIIVKNLKDKKLADQQMSVFTFDEVSNYEQALHASVFNESDRLQEGKCSSTYLPKHNAHCVMDVMLALSEANAFYMPSHKEADGYNRIGRKVTDIENRFVKNNEPILAPLSQFVFAKDKLNLSIQFTVNGIVKLNPKSAKRVGLDADFSSQIFRTHTVIKNGTLNMDSIIVALPKTLHQKLKKLGTDLKSMAVLDVLSKNNPLTKLAQEHNEEYTICKICLSSLPIINRTYLEKVTMSKVFKVCNEMLQDQAYQKCLNTYIKKIYSIFPDAKQEHAFVSLTPEQIDVLEDYGIDKRGNYVGINNTMETVEEADSYEIRKLAFNFKGFSSLPSLDAVFKKKEAIKTKGSGSLTPSQQIIADAEEKLLTTVKEKHGDFEDLQLSMKEIFEKELEEVKFRLKRNSYWLSGLKIAKVLTGDWFKELTTFDKKGNYVFEETDKVLLVKSEIAKEYI